MIQSVNDFIWEYLHAKDGASPEYDPVFFLLYGPYMVTHSEFKGIVDDLRESYYGLNYLKKCMDCYNVVSDASSIKIGKENIIALVKDSAKKEGENPAFESVCNAWLNNIREYTIENKLMESAMMNIAPIVPYSSILAKPELESYLKKTTKIYNSSISDKSYGNANYFIDVLTDTSINTYSLMSSILECYPYDIINLTEWATGVIDRYDSKKNNSLPAFLLRFIMTTENRNFKTISFPLLMLYYFTAYVSFFGYPISTVIRELRSLHNTLDPKISTFKLVQEFSSNEYGELAMEHYLNEESIREMKHVVQSEVERLLQKDASTDPYATTDKLYNLDKLLGYLYTHREMVCSEYANQFFVNNCRNQKLTNFSYMHDEIMLCEVDERFMVIPFMDMANDRKIKLLLMDKDDNISIKETFDFDGTEDTMSDKALLD